MTRLRGTNGEVGIYSAEGWSRLGVGAEVVRDSTLAHAGSFSWCVAGDGVAKNSWQAPTITNGVWYIIRGYIRISAAPGTEQSTFLQAGAGATPILPLRLLTSGALGTPSSSQMPVTSSPALTPTAWHKLEIAYRVNPTDALQHDIFFRLDGTEFGRFAFRAANNLTRLLFTTAASGFPVRINLDDIFINDSAGSSDNYWVDDVRPLSRSALGYASPTVRSTGTRSSGSTTGSVLTVTAPGTIVEGDVLLAVVNMGGANDVPTPPVGGGWTQRGKSLGNTAGVGYLFTKTATASEPSSYTFTSSTGATTYTSIAWSLAGVKTSNPIIDSSMADIPASTVSMTAPPLDMSEGDALMFEFGYFSSASITLSSNFPSASSGSVNNKTGNNAIFGGFFSRSDGGLAGGEVATLSGASPIGFLTQVAFRAADPIQNRYLAVA